MMGFNTALVFISVLSLGISSAIIGSYIMLNKKTLVSDAVSHATLPGIALGYFAGIALGLGDNQNLPLLLIGAAISGAASSYLIGYLIKVMKLPEDASIAITLSLFFALGIILFGVIQSLDFGVNRSGLDRFLLGQTSGITLLDTLIITLCAITIAAIALTYHKAFIFMGYDAQLFGHLSPSPHKTSLVLSLLMLIVICLGLKTTGALLVLALIIIPPATARLWCDKNRNLVLVSALLGGFAAIAGTLLSAHLDNAPTGATITLILFSVFTASLIVHKARHSLLFKKREAA